MMQLLVIENAFDTEPCRQTAAAASASPHAIERVTTRDVVSNVPRRVVYEQRQAPPPCSFRIAMPQLLPFDGTSISTDEMFPRSVCFSVPDAELPACPRRQAEQRAARRELQNDWLRLQAQMRTLSLLGNATSPARVASARRDTRGGSLSPTEFARGVSRLQDALQHVADMSHSVQSAQRMCVLQLHQMDAQTKALRQQRRLEEQEYFVPEGQHEMIASEANRSRQLQLQ